MATKNFDAEEKKDILKALREISDLWTQIESARDAVKNIKKTTCKELELDRKTFTKVAKLFHKNNLGEQEAEFAEVKSMFKSLGK